MEAHRALQQLGGCATTGELRRLVRKRDIAAAVRAGLIVRTGRGTYAVPGLQESWREAHRLAGVVSGRSAAQFWRLSLRLAPGAQVTPEVTVPRNRKVPLQRRRGVVVRWRDLPDGAVVPRGEGRVTSLVQTVVDCCRDLPEADALCVVDSALRKGVRRSVLLAAADRLPRGRARVRRVIELGDGRAANAFESCLRHIALTVPGLDVVPQVQIGPHRVDLADERGIVVEAESYAFHGSKQMFRLDCRRYTWLTTHGWTVWRFVWEDVVLAPERVRKQMLQGLASRSTCSSCGGPSRPT